MPPHRLPAPAGSHIDRTQQLRFQFEGRPYTGHPGDTVASALAANGIQILSRSFKYHRPRGIHSLTGQEANTLIQLPHEPNVLADRHPLRDGMDIRGQNYSGSLEKDRAAIIDRLSRFLPVGFYYRTFHRPRGAWQKIWEPFFRKKAGLGVINPATPRGHYDHTHTHCDLAIIGGGPAGLAAAIEAARLGKDLILIDENPQLGGALHTTRFDPEGKIATATRQQLLTDLATHTDRIRLLTNATCNGWFPDNTLPVIQGPRLHKIRAREIIIASGGHEQPLTFRNNDLPGILLGTAAQRLIKHYGIRPGDRAVIATTNDSGYGVALDLAAIGIDIAAIVDLRATPPTTPLRQATQATATPHLDGQTPYEAQANPRGTLHAIDIRPITGAGQCAPLGQTIPCDLLCLCGGDMPTWQLPCQAGARLDHDPTRDAFTLRHLPPTIRLAGSINGATDLTAILNEGRAAARSEPPPPPPPTKNETNTLFPHPKGKEFIDLDEDLCIADITDAIADGYTDIQLVKRYTTAGMGPSQGRHSASPTARLTAKATGKTLSATGITTARPPLTPEKLGLIAGRPCHPTRRTPLHHSHLALGATMMPVGLWWRPAHYGKNRALAIQQEAQHIRQQVGLIDISTLGKLEIRGPDAVEWMNRLYTGQFTKQKPGRTKYIIHCNEHGIVIDDGIACRHNETHFTVTATTSGIDTLHRAMLKWNAQWRLDIDIANVTSAWCAINLAGPRSREVLTAAGIDLDLGPTAFPHMALQSGAIAGIPARLMRVGFVGELGYEIHIPAGHGETLWQTLLTAGRPHDIRPFGVEAQRLLRLEKGHLIIGQDSDSLSTPAELGLDWTIAKDKPYHIGAPALRLMSEHPPKRRLIGFTLDPAAAIPQESHLIIDNGQIIGRITSCEHSPTLQKTIGLATVTPTHAAPGTPLPIRLSDGKTVTAHTTPPPFYDPQSQRQTL